LDGNLKHLHGTQIRRDILRTLSLSFPDFSSGEKMSSLFGLSRAGLWKHIEKLRREGYEIESFPRKGYRLAKFPNKLTAESIRAGLSGGIFSRAEIHCFENVGSTNKIACSLAEQGALEGTIVTSESQSKGRGRMGREWVSPPGGLYFSIILRPEIRIDEIPAITLAAASSVAKSISKISRSDVRVKWPNDIFIGGKKVCGILAETRAHADRTDFLIVGIGINVDTPAAKLPLEAVSIRSATGITVDRVGLLSSVLCGVGYCYTVFNEKGFKSFRDESKSMSLVLGKEVRVKTNRGVLSGKAVDIDERGALVLMNAVGELSVVFSGDVTLGENFLVKEEATI
jgi:BirA family transcriptional regulator, biotin operon repressor / biotin---[acetyl-CoA-carboxylase] ligase